MESYIYNKDEIEQHIYFVHGCVVSGFRGVATCTHGTHVRT